MHLPLVQKHKLADLGYAEMGAICYPICKGFARSFWAPFYERCVRDIQGPSVDGLFFFHLSITRFHPVPPPDVLCRVRRTRPIRHVSRCEENTDETGRGSWGAVGLARPKLDPRT